MNPGDAVQVFNKKSIYHLATGVVQRYTQWGDVVVQLDNYTYKKFEPFAPYDVQPIEEEAVTAE